MGKQEQMSLFQLLPIAILGLIGAVLGLFVHMLFPSFRSELGVFLLGIPLVLTMTWPIYVPLNLRPFITKFPNCGSKSPYFRTDLHIRGLLHACPICEGHFILRGKWRLKDEMRTYRCDPEAKIEVVDSNGDVLAIFRLGWPRPFGRWVKDQR